MKRVQCNRGVYEGQILLFGWWLTVRRFRLLTDAVKWLGYDW